MSKHTPIPDHIALIAPDYPGENTWHVERVTYGALIKRATRMAEKQGQTLDEAARACYTDHDLTPPSKDLRCWQALDVLRRRRTFKVFFPGDAMDVRLLLDEAMRHGIGDEALALVKQAA